jgi:hypothetical protein
MKNKQFRFVYSFDENETPDCFHVQANNVTNAKIDWENHKKNNYDLLAIFCGDQEVWVGKSNTNYNLSAI